MDPTDNTSRDITAGRLIITVMTMARWYGNTRWRLKWQQTRTSLVWHVNQCLLFTVFTNQMVVPLKQTGGGRLEKFTPTPAWRAHISQMCSLRFWLFYWLYC
jgi:hypothetical protein